MVDIKKEQERDELHRAIWAIADELRGSIDGWDFKSYVLGMMFYRYISENLTNYINEGEIEAGNEDFDYAKLSDEEAEQAREDLVQTKGFFILPSELFCNVRKKASSDENLNMTLESVFNHIEESAKGSESEDNFAGLFDDIDVKDIVTPRKDIVAIDVTMDVDEIHQLFEESKFTRLPVYRDSIDNIIGILHEKDFYSYLIKRENEEFRINELMKPPHFVSQETKISIVFKTFKDQHYHMAVVLDQFDSTLGIITLEDVIEELVGEIFDETDEIYEETKQINDDNYLVSGKELLEDAFSIMNIEDEEEDLNQTINSWLSKKLSHLPTSGDNFIYQDKWKVFVNSANKKGAVEVSFKKL